MMDDKNKGRLGSLLRMRGARVPGDYSILLRGTSKKKSLTTSFSRDDVEADVDSSGADEREDRHAQVTIFCRAQNVRVDQIDTGTRINDRVVYNYRISFVGGNHKLIAGDHDLYIRLPVTVPIILNSSSQPLTQWDGEDVEVTGSSYMQGGVFEADSIIVPKLGGFRIVKDEGGPLGAFVLVLVVILIAGFLIFNVTTT